MTNKLHSISSVLIGLALAGDAAAQWSKFVPPGKDLTAKRQDFVVSGASTRVDFGHQTNPFNLDVAGIPAGSTVTGAYLNWSYLTNGENSLNEEGTIFFGGTAVVGDEAGRRDPDLGWGRNSVVSYTADVTPLVGGNGTYSVVDAVDEEANGTLSALGEGMSLVVIFSNPNSTRKLIDTYHGLWSTNFDDSPMSFALQPRASNNIDFFINALDGQDFYTDDFLINGESAAQIGPGEFGDAWQGKLGPGPKGENYYDHFRAEIGGYVAPEDTSFTAMTEGFVNNDGTYTDAVGHSFAVVAYEPVPEPASLLALLLGGSSLLRARRRSGRESAR